MSTRVTIGDFSRAAHLSVKTLRHYHDVGLLEPCEVDPSNGYRYYSEEQIPLAQVIRRLRGLQMPVAEVKSVLAAPDATERNALILSHLDRLEAELAATRTAVGELRDLLERPDVPLEVEHRSVAPCVAIAVTEMVERESALTWWQGALGELKAVVLAQRLEPAGVCGGLFDGEIFQYGRGRATVFVPLAGEARAAGRIVSLTVPAAELAVVRHAGPLDDIDLTYGGLGAYVMRHEIGVDGPLRENYLCSFLDEDDPARWVTEVGWPVFRSDAGVG